METITLKEFIDETFKNNPIGGLQALTKLVELESIENWLNIMYGVELDIKVRPIEKKEGRFYGKSLIDSIPKSKF